jgi:predicted MFS family arabinose efflux permease
LSPAAPSGRPAATVAARSSAPAAATARYANYVLGLLFVVYVFNFVDRQILSLLLDPIKADLGVSDSALGFLTGLAFALFYTVAGIPIARYADRGPRRTIIAVGLFVWSAMTACSGLARNFAQLALARVGVGVGEAAGSPPAHSLLSDYFPPERRATALSIYNAGIYVGAMFGALAGGWLSELFSWRVAFFVVGIPGLALAVAVRATIREPARGVSEHGAAEGGRESVAEVARFLLRRRTFVLAAVGCGVTAFAGYGFGAWVPPFLGRVRGMGPGEIGTWVGLANGIAGAAGSIAGGYLADRLVRRDPRWYLWIPAWSTIVSIPVGIPFLMLPGRLESLLWYFPYNFFGSMFLGPVIAVCYRLVKVQMRALTSAILLFIINLIGLGGGPQAVGILNDLLAPRLGAEAVRYSLLWANASALVAVLLFFLAARTLKRDLAVRDAAAS